MSTKIPTLTGFPSTYANIGETSNKGIEVTLNAVPIDLKMGFTWETNFNIAYQKDKIDVLAYGKNDMVDNGWFIGKSLSVHYAYDNEGIWQDTPEDRAEMQKWNDNGYDFSPGNVRPKDQNGDYAMDDKDRVVLGNQNPKWTMGWTNNFSYKGIELGLLCLVVWDIWFQQAVKLLLHTLISIKWTIGHRIIPVQSFRNQFWLRLLPVRLISFLVCLVTKMLHL